MKIATRVLNNVLIVDLKGKILGGPEAAELADVLKTEIAKGHLRFIFNLGEVDWMNSSGLGLMISSLTTIKNAGGELKLAAVTEKIISLLMITRLVTIFDSCNTVDEALKSF